jgi:hypothetical protein
MKIGDRNDVIVGDEEEIEMLSKLVEIVEKTQSSVVFVQDMQCEGAASVIRVRN